MSHYDQFKSQDPARALSVIAQFPFATISKNNIETGFPDHVEVPIVASDIKQNNGGMQFEFHMARGNDVFENFKRGGKVTAIFIGPSAHISPSFYQNTNHGQTAPTYNYVRAAIKGEITPMVDADLAAHLNNLVNTFENNTKNGWNLNKLDKTLLNQWSQHIQGFKLSVHHIDIIEKLSQDKPKDIKNIIENLKSRNIGLDYILANYIQTLQG